MLRRCSRQQRSQVQFSRSSSSPRAQVKRTTDSSSAMRPQVAQTAFVASWLIRPVSLTPAASEAIFGTMATSLIEPPTSGLVRRQWREGGPGATDRNECRSVGGSGGARLGGVYTLHRDRLAAGPPTDLHS